MGKVDDLKVKLARIRIPILPYDRVNHEGNVEHVDFHWRTVDVNPKPRNATLPDSSTLAPVTPDEDYQGDHTPNPDGPRVFDMLEGGMMPKDFYEHPEWYVGDPNSREAAESIAAIRAAYRHPSKQIRVYRASPKGTKIQPGDWVTLSPAYARMHAKYDPDFTVHSKVVRAAEVRFAGDDLNEFGYFPEEFDRELEAKYKTIRLDAMSPEARAAMEKRRAEFYAKWLKEDATLPDSSTRAPAALPDIEKSTAALKDEGAMDVLEEVFGNRMNTPVYGGCLITAQALQRVHGGELHVIVTTSQEHLDYAEERGMAPMVEHFVVKIGDDQFIDGNGLHTEEELLSNMKYPWAGDLRPYGGDSYMNQIVPAPPEWVADAEQYINSPPGAAEKMEAYIRGYEPRTLPDVDTLSPLKPAPNLTFEYRKPDEFGQAITAINAEGVKVGRIRWADMKDGVRVGVTVQMPYRNQGVGTALMLEVEKNVPEGKRILHGSFSSYEGIAIGLLMATENPDKHALELRGGGIWDGKSPLMPDMIDVFHDSNWDKDKIQALIDRYVPKSTLPETETQQAIHTVPKDLGMAWAFRKQLKSWQKDKLYRALQLRAQPSTEPLYRGVKNGSAAPKPGEVLQYRMAGATSDKELAANYASDYYVIEFLPGAMHAPQHPDIEHYYREKEHIVTGQYRVIKAGKTEHVKSKWGKKVPVIKVEYVGPVDEASGVQIPTTNDGGTLAPLRSVRESLPGVQTSAPRRKKPEIHDRSIKSLRSLVYASDEGVLPYFEDPMHKGDSGYANSSEFEWDYKASGITTGDILGYNRLHPNYDPKVTKEAHYIPAYWDDEFKQYVLNKAEFLNFDGVHPARADRNKVAKKTQVLNLGRGFGVSAQYHEMYGGKKPNVLIKIEKGTPLLDLRDLIDVPNKYEHLALVNGKYRIQSINQHKDGTLVVTVEGYKWNNPYHAYTEDPSPDVSDDMFLDARYADSEEIVQHLLEGHHRDDAEWLRTEAFDTIHVFHDEQHEYDQAAINDKTHLRHHGVPQPHPIQFGAHTRTLALWVGEKGTLNGSSGDARMVADTILAGEPKDGRVFTAEEVKALMDTAQNTEIPYQVVRYERQFHPFRQFRKDSVVTFGLASTSRNDDGHAKRYGNPGGFGADDGGQRVKFMFLPGARGLDITKYIWDNSEAHDKEHIVTGDYRIVGTKVIDGERVVVLEYKGPASRTSTIKGNPNARKRGVDLGGSEPVAAKTVTETFESSLFKTPSLEGTAFEMLEGMKAGMSVEEIQTRHDETLKLIRPVIENIVGRKSDWSGKVNVKPIEYANLALAQKNWNCDITINSDIFEPPDKFAEFVSKKYALQGATRLHTLVHEMLHSLSATTSLNGKTQGERKGNFVQHSEWEEGVVELLSMHITANILGMDTGDPAFQGMRLASGYEDMIDGLSELAFLLDMSEQDLMVELMQIPISQRGSYLMGILSAAGKKDEALWALEMLMGEDSANRLWMRFSAGLDRAPKPMNDKMPPTPQAVIRLVREAGGVPALRWLKSYGKSHPDQQYAMSKLAHIVAMMTEPD